MKKNVLAVIFVALGLVLLRLLNPFNVEAGSEKAVFFSGSSPHFTPLFIADSQAFFKEEGLDVRVVTFASGIAATEAFRAGKGHLIAAVDLPLLKLWEGGDVVAVATFANDAEGNTIIAQRHIRKASDLKGKKVGVPLKTGLDLLLRKYLELGGVSPKEVTMVNMSPVDGVIALDKGEIAAFSIWQPFGFQSMEVSRDKVHVLATGKDLITSTTFLISTTREYAKAHVEEIKAMIRALVKSRKFILENPERTASIISDRLKLDKVMVEKMYQFIRWDLAYTRAMAKDIQAHADFMVEQGTLKQRVDINSFFDPRFLRAVDPSLVE